MKKDKVSVIIPAYHCAGTIRKAIDSALMQEVPLEVLVIDDCGGEDIEGIVKEYGAEPRLFYVKNEKNLGAAATRNKAARLATGNYLAYLDADDWWEKGKLQKQLLKLQETGDVLCCTARELATPEGNLTGKVIPVHERLTYRELLKHNQINCSSVLIRREAALKFPMEHEDSHEDYITWLRVLKEYGTASGINEPLLKYRLSSQGKSGSKLHSAAMTFKVYRYMGFGMGRSVLCFLSYAAHGIWKYLT